MKKIAIIGLLFAAVSASAVEIGGPAPDFTLEDIDGNAHSLADFKGSVVVLEWTNYDCPFVKKHYGANNMQELQKKYTDEGVVWLSVCSSAPGKQGHYSAQQWQEKTGKAGSAMTALLLDGDGQVGRLYGAKTTPHMFVIDKDGNLRYEGAIDSNSSWDPKTIPDAENYVAKALDELLAGQSVSTAKTKSYGCSVKY